MYEAITGVVSFLTSDPDRMWSLLSATLAGIIGALAGGVPAYLIALSGSKEALLKEKKREISSELSILRSLFIKLAEIANDYFSICSQLNESLYEAHVKGEKDMALWQKLKPIVGFADEEPIRFTSSEIELFMRGPEDVDFVNDLLLLNRRHSVFIASLKLYADKRERLLGLLKSSGFDDGVSVTYLTEEQLDTIKPLAHSVDTIALTILTRMHDERRTTQRLTSEFGIRATRLYPKEKVPQFGTFGETVPSTTSTTNEDV